MNISSEGCNMVLHKNSEVQALHNGSWGFIMVLGGSSQFNTVALSLAE